MDLKGFLPCFVPSRSAQKGQANPMPHEESKLWVPLDGNGDSSTVQLASASPVLPASLCCNSKHWLLQGTDQCTGFQVGTAKIVNIF